MTYYQIYRKRTNQNHKNDLCPEILMCREKRGLTTGLSGFPHSLTQIYSTDEQADMSALPVRWQIHNFPCNRLLVWLFHTCKRTGHNSPFLDVPGLDKPSLTSVVAKQIKKMGPHESEWHVWVMYGGWNDMKEWWHPGKRLPGDTRVS